MKPNKNYSDSVLTLFALIESQVLEDGERTRALIDLLNGDELRVLLAETSALAAALLTAKNGSETGAVEELHQWRMAHLEGQCAE